MKVSDKYGILSLMEKPRFVDDIIVHNALTGILLRSPVASGILQEIQTPKLPYNVSLVGFADIPGQKTCSFGKTGDQMDKRQEIPIFPEKELSWYGQPVGLLLGPDPEKLRELAEQCTVLAEARPFKTEKSIIAERNYSIGETGEAFEKAEMVVEGTYTTEIQDPWPSDPPGVIAMPGPENTMTIYASTQWPGQLRSSVARCLNVKPSMVEVELCRLEIHLDSKLMSPSLLACQAAVGAKVRDKPVKLVLLRSEDFLFSSKSIRAAVYIQSAITKQGQILGSWVHITADFGAYGIFANEILDRIALGALSAYNHGAIDLQTQGLTSPIPPAGPMGGFGFAQGFFAAERHASRIADAVGEDPAKWRKSFYLGKGKKLAIGAEIRDPFREQVIDAAAAMSDYRRKWAAYELLRKNRRENPVPGHDLTEPLRGIGIALAYQGNSFLYDYRPPLSKSREEGIDVTMEKDGSLEIRTNFPWGTNQLECWQLLAEKILGVKEIRICSRSEDPSNPVPESGPACLSRDVGVLANLVEKACNAIRKQRFRDPLPITIHRHYNPSKAPAWSQNGTSTTRGSALEENYDENALASLSWGSAIVETEIDPVAHIPRIRGVWMALDGGTILSEERARKNVSNAAVQALSWAMNEKASYLNGRIDTRTAKHYPIPGIEESPLINIEFLKPGGNPKGIGELPFAVIPAAYVQSLSQALDYPFENYPVHAADIWMAFRNMFILGD